MISGYNSNIEKIKDEISDVEIEHQNKLNRMAKARADLKVMEKLKEKDLLKFKRETSKKLQGDLEELVIMKKNGANQKL